MLRPKSSGMIGTLVLPSLLLWHWPVGQKDVCSCCPWKSSGGTLPRCPSTACQGQVADGSTFIVLERRVDTECEVELRDSDLEHANPISQ